MSLTKYKYTYIQPEHKGMMYTNLELFRQEGRITIFKGTYVPATDIRLNDREKERFMPTFGEVYIVNIKEDEKLSYNLYGIIGEHFTDSDAGIFELCAEENTPLVLEGYYYTIIDMETGKASNRMKCGSLNQLIDSLITMGICKLTEL